MSDIGTLAAGMTPQIYHLAASLASFLPAAVGAGALHSVVRLALRRRSSASNVIGPYGQQRSGFVGCLMGLALLFVCGAGVLPGIGGATTMAAEAQQQSLIGSLPGTADFTLPSMNGVGGFNRYANALNYATINGGHR